METERAMASVLATGGLESAHRVCVEFSPDVVVHEVCRIVDVTRPKDGRPYRSQVRFLEDRPGHDPCCALDRRTGGAHAQRRGLLS